MSGTAVGLLAMAAGVACLAVWLRRRRTAPAGAALGSGRTGPGGVRGIGPAGSGGFGLTGHGSGVGAAGSGGFGLAGNGSGAGAAGSGGMALVGHGSGTGVAGPGGFGVAGNGLGAVVVPDRTPTWLVVRVGVVRAVRRLGRLVRLAPLRRAIERDLGHAGIAGSVEVEDVLALQVVGGGLGLLATAALAAAGFVDGVAAVLTAATLLVVGALLPVVVLRRRAERRQAALRARLPDALDLLVLCLEAGQGFDAAIATVGESVPGPLGAEMARVIGEMALGVSRVEALGALAARNDAPELDALVLALQQADALGAPVGNVLSAQSDQTRARRQQELREQAAKLPVRILGPTVLLIFPATFVVLLGPAFASIRGVFG